jgi:hypothetical protein
MSRAPAWRDAGQGVAAAVASFGAMAATAGLALALLDPGRGGGLGAQTAAVVALAVGGSVDLRAGLPESLPIAMQGSVEVMPLGVSLVGALALTAVLVLPLRRRPGSLLVRAAAAVAAFAVGLVLVPRLGRGSLSLPDGGSGEGGASACVGAAAPPPGSVAGRAAVGGPLDVGFAAATGRTLLAGLIWVVAVAGLCWLARHRTLPVVRAGAATLTVLLSVLVAATMAGLLVAAIAGGPKALGTGLLALPLALCTALPLGLGVPPSVTAKGPLACVLGDPDQVATVGLGRTPALALAAATLLACGILAAARTPAEPGRGGFRHAARQSVRVAVVIAVVMAVMALLAEASVRLGVSAFGFSLPVLEARLRPDPLAAGIAGLVGGGLAGFVGSLIVDRFRRPRSVFWRPWRRIPVR